MSPLPASIGPDEIGVLSTMLDSDSVQPGQLFPLHFGHGATVCNAMMYDKFHGKGWSLNLVTGWFERDVAHCKDSLDCQNPKPKIQPPCPQGPPPPPNG